MDKTFDIYDKSYKQLFSNKTIFKQLIQSFVDEPWVKKVNFDSAELINKTYISNRYKKRESDLIYKLNFEGNDLYIYLLLEFQSSPDKFMPVRVLNYITSLYLDMIKRKGDNIKLPPIFPLVLYNGDKKWNYSNNISDLIENSHLIGDYALNFKHLLLKENEYSLEKLLKIGNIVSTLFISESHYDIELLKDELLKLYDNEQDKTACKIFFNFFQQMYINEKIEEIDYNKIEEVYTTKEEVNSMLLNAIRKEKEDIRIQGRLEGRVEGRLEGKLETARQRLKNLLNRKFGNVSENILSKIDSCEKAENLEKSIDSIFDINSPEEILKDI